jgi:chromosome partitioning protein
MRTIAFFNQKGGTAKTTSTLNVAAALVERGARVLVVDMDPQASLSMAMGIDIPTLQYSMYDALSDDDVRLCEVLQPSSIAGVWIAPSHPDLAAAELELLNVLERERRFAYSLSGLSSEAFDYVLVDSPPALNILSINILVGVRELVVPIEPHPLSVMVLRRLFETITRVRRLNPQLRVLGFLPTKVHHSSRLAADMIETLKEQFPTVPMLTPVPLSVKGAESIVEHTSILDYMPNSPLSMAYREIAATLAEAQVEQARHV